MEDNETLGAIIQGSILWNAISAENFWTNFHLQISDKVPLKNAQRHFKTIKGHNYKFTYGNFKSCP
jgi:hypothetical protein